MELLTIEQLREQNYELQGVIIKSYLSFPIKRLLIKNILSICTNEEQNIKRIDYVLKQFAFEFSLISQYTNLNFENNEVNVNLYDELKEHGTIDAIIEQIPKSELDFIYNILEKEIEQIQLVDNSISVVISNVLNTIIDKLPDEKGMTKLIKDLPKQINKINPEKLSFLSSAIDWNNGKVKEG